MGKAFVAHDNRWLWVLSVAKGSVLTGGLINGVALESGLTCHPKAARKCIGNVDDPEFPMLNQRKALQEWSADQLLNRSYWGSGSENMVTAA